MTMKSRRYLLAAFLSISAFNIQAQTLNSAYFTNDFKYRHTMNPAYDNSSNYIAIPALGNVNVRTQANFGYDAVIMPNPLAGQPGQKIMATFMHPEIDNGTALGGFSTGTNRFLGNINATLLSAGFKSFGGYSTIEINAKGTFGLSVPYELLEFAKNTGNRSYEIGNIDANAMAWTEIAFGHSRNISEKLRVGAKIKFLLGVGRADLKLENMRADLTQANRWIVSGSATADVSMKSFKFKEETKEYKNDERGSYRRVNDVEIDKFGLDGFGLAFDLGGVYKIDHEWTVSAALLDIGFISWSNDNQACNATSQFEFDGFHDVAVTNDRPGKYGTITQQSDNYIDQITDFINVQDQGDKGGRTTGIGATLNIGASYNFPGYRPLTIGLLSSTRIYGPYSWTEGRLSANWSPVKWLNGGVNVAVGSLSSSAGWVLNIHPKGFNFFVGMDHILGKLSKEGIPLSAKASATVGMNVTW